MLERQFSRANETGNTLWMVRNGPIMVDFNSQDAETKGDAQLELLRNGDVQLPELSDGKHKHEHVQDKIGRSEGHDEGHEVDARAFFRIPFPNAVDRQTLKYGCCLKSDVPSQEPEHYRMADDSHRLDGEHTFQEA